MADAASALSSTELTANPATEGPLSAQETTIWRGLCARRPAVPAGRPDAKHLQLLKQFKVDMQKFIDSLTSDKKAYVHAQEKKRSRQRSSHVSRARASPSTTGSKLTALALVADEGSPLWRVVQPIRRRHDRMVNVWPPHINILYPFVVPTLVDPAAQSLYEALADFPPLKINFRYLTLTLTLNPNANPQP